MGGEGDAGLRLEGSEMRLLAGAARVATVACLLT